MQMSNAIKISDAESEVMKVLWAGDEPMTERQILDILGSDSEWSPTTIKTLIKRLFDKGAVQREKRGVFYYMPVLSQTAFSKGRTEDLVNKVFGGNAKNLVAAMLGDNILSEDDMDDLKNYWKKRKRKNE
jgi:BlaI family penicillinase repressor